MEAISDNELARRAGGGDREALANLVGRHYNAIYRLAYRWSASQPDAQDIAQEVCVKLARKIGSFDGRSAFTTWLYRIVINTAQDFSRSVDTRRRREAAFAQSQEADGGGLEIPPEPNPGCHGPLQAALDKLPAKQKSAVLLVLSQGLSHREAARILGCFEATVAWRIHQARKKLARLLDM